MPARDCRAGHLERGAGLRAQARWRARERRLRPPQAAFRRASSSRAQARATGRPARRARTRWRAPARRQRRRPPPRRRPASRPASSRCAAARCMRVVAEVRSTWYADPARCTHVEAGAGSTWRPHPARRLAWPCCRARSAGLPLPRLPPCCSAAGRAGQRRPQRACIAARSSLLAGATQRRWSITSSSVSPGLMARAPQAQAAAAAPPEADAADAGPPAKRQRAGAGAAPPAADAPGALPKGAAPAVRWGLELQALSGALGSAPCKL